MLGRDPAGENADRSCQGRTVEQVKELKAAAIRGAAAEQKVKELKVENQQLHSRIPSMKEKLKEAEERQRLINENRNLQVQVEYLENSLDSERNFASRLLEGVEAVLDFLDRHLPEQFRPMLEARELLPVRSCNSRNRSRIGATPGAAWNFDREKMY